jgi:hypothetical protein
MTTSSFILGVLIVVSGSSIFAQSRLPRFSEITAEEIHFKECSFDKEAEAVVIFDDAWTDYDDDDYKMRTTRRVRIKILNEKGLDRGNVIIPFYSKDGFEYIDKIKAVTINAEVNGKISHTELDKKSVFTEKKDNYYSLIKFAMPAVRAGSIIEYSYTSIMKNYGGLEEWKFQTDMPTLKSCYMLQILPRAEFTYGVQKRNSYPITIKPLPKEGRIYFEMNNVPALREEPYMDAQRDYVQKVTFQLSGMLNQFGHKENVNTTWKAAAADLINNKSFGGQFDKDLKDDELKQILLQKSTDIQRLTAIYDYVRTNMTWNGYYSLYAEDGIKKAWENKSGNSGEINLLLINLLKASGIETYPVLAAERDFGKIDTTYPFLDRFNRVVAFSIADGKQFILDATQSNTPVGLTPYQFLNTTAFLVDKRRPSFLAINAGSSKFYKNKIKITAELNSKGQLHGIAEIDSYDYAKEQRGMSIKKDQRKFVAAHFEKPFQGLVVDSFLFVTPGADTVPLKQQIKFSQQLNENGGFVFINYNLFTGLEKNPFTSSVRFTNVNFGFPYHVSSEQVFSLPPGSKADLPENKLLQSADGKINLLRDIKFESGEIRVKLLFTQTITLIKSEDYPALKDFYKSMVDMLNEPVVVKLGN